VSRHAEYQRFLQNNTNFLYRANDNNEQGHAPMTTIPYTMTNDSITVILDGKPHHVQQGTPQFNGLRDALYREDWAAISTHLSPAGALQQWLGDKFVVATDGKTISLAGAVLPASLTTRIWTMAAAGESPAPLFAFYERLQRNPSHRSVQQLFNFLGHVGIPIEPDGTFLAYKGVRSDFLDAHSGTLSNVPGAILSMPRNQISDDPDYACHVGLHVGALSYAHDFSARVVVVRVDPEHVVCVPKDYESAKMRTCQYEVIGNWVGESNDSMPSTTYTPDVAVRGEHDEQEWGGEVEDGTPSVELAVEDEIDRDPQADFEGDDDDCEIDKSGTGTISDVIFGTIYGDVWQLDASDDDDDDDLPVLKDEDLSPESREALQAWRNKLAADRTFFEVTDRQLKKQPTLPANLAQAERTDTAKANKSKAASFNRMNPARLMEQSIDDLRKYASAHLKIVGASKMPGGKAVLVSKILRARKRR